jgi:DNA-binding transcriptional ArsR family regulator
MSRARSAAARKIEDAAHVFSALGDATRLGLVQRLSAEGPLSGVALTEGSGVTRQAVAKHLRALSDAGLVRDHRDGRARIFELDARRLSDARRAIDRLSAQWDEALLRLRELVED